MKKSSILKLFSLLTFAAAGAFAVAAAKGSKKAEVAKAETTIDIGNSGTIMLQLNTAEWKSSGSKIGLYMFNNSVSKSAWGNLVTPSGSSRFVEYSYSLDFTPAQCIAFRFAPGVETMGEWCWENDRGNEAIWATTNDTDFNNVVWLGNYFPDSKWTESGAYDLSAVVKGGSSGSWSEATVDTQLTHVKVNGSDNLEVYGEVILPAGTYFKVVKGSGSGTWCGAYSAHSSIQSNLSGGGESNIHNSAAATYEFYFDYDGESVYITDPVMAEADEWAQYFLSHVGCDSKGISLPSGWSACAEEYGKLSGDAKNLIYGSTAKEDGSYIEQAVARYDYAVAHHASLTKFIVNSSSVARASINLEFVNDIYSTTQSSNLIIIVSIVSLISASTLVGLIVLKKRKVVNK
jgi:hypothetical protein